MTQVKKTQTSFIKKHFVAIFTLIISVFGGFPGCKVIADWFNNKPDFTFHQQSMADGSFMAGTSKYGFFFLTGAIYNDGDLPLFPVHFALQMNYDGQLLVFPSSPMVDSFANKPMEQVSGAKLQIVDPYDLKKVARVNPHDAVYGSLVFITDYIEYDLGRIKDARILCEDITGKRYSKLLTFNSTNPTDLENGRLYDPRTGIGIGN